MTPAPRLAPQPETVAPDVAYDAAVEQFAEAVCEARRLARLQRRRKRVILVIEIDAYGRTSDESHVEPAWR